MREKEKECVVEDTRNKSSQKGGKNLSRDFSKAARLLELLLVVMRLPTARAGFQVCIGSSKSNARANTHVMLPDNKPSKISNVPFDLAV